MICAELTYNGFAGKSVKSISVDPFGLQSFLYRKKPRDIGQSCMESRVETRKVRQGGKMLRGKFDDGKRGRSMQRSKSDGSFKLLQNGGIDQGVAANARPTMNDGVPNGSGESKPPLIKKFPNSSNGTFLIGNGYFLRQHMLTGCIKRREIASVLSDGFSFTRQHPLQAIHTDAVETELQRG